MWLAGLPEASTRRTYGPAKSASRETRAGAIAVGAPTQGAARESRRAQMGAAEPLPVLSEIEKATRRPFSSRPTPNW